MHILSNHEKWALIEDFCDAQYQLEITARNLSIGNERLKQKIGIIWFAFINFASLILEEKDYTTPKGRLTSPYKYKLEDNIFKGMYHSFEMGVSKETPERMRDLIDSDGFEYVDMSLKMKKASLGYYLDNQEVNKDHMEPFVLDLMY